MASPPKPWKAEYAKSSRSSCKTCKNPIDKEFLRLGKVVQSPKFDGFMPMWNHADCILRKAKQIKLVDDVEGIELLRWEDQQKIRKYVEGGGGVGGSGSSHASSPSPATVECGIEVSQTSRASCRRCSQKIMKGEVRISSKPEGQGPRSLAWHHANCFMEMSPTTNVEKLSGWLNLLAADQTTVLALAKSGSSTVKGENVELNEEPVKGSTSKASAKRKRAVGENEKSKLAKAEEDPSANKAVSEGKNINVKAEHGKTPDLESQLEVQTRALWVLKDDFKKHVSTAELREMLEINNQDSSGSELDLRERW